MNGELPGEFAIRTYLKQTYLTARGGGGHSIDAVITSATAVGENEKFKLTSVQPDITTIQTLDGHYVSAVAGGGLGGEYGASQTLQTERTSVADDALFRFRGPDVAGRFTIWTFNNHLLTALGGGGKEAAAFHSDATTANTWENFYVLKCGDLGTGYTYSIIPTGLPITDEALFLTAYNGGGVTNPAIIAGPLTYAANFKLLQLADGSYALQTPNGINFLTAVNGGGLANGENLHTDATRIRGWETFRIADQGDGAYTIKTASGFYLAVSPIGAISTRISDPNAAPDIGYYARFHFTMVGLIKQSP